MRNSCLYGLSPLTLLLGPTDDDSGSGDRKDEFSLHDLPVLQQDGDGEEKIEKGQ